VIASDAPAAGGAAGRRPRRWLLVLLIVAVVVALGSGGAALAIRLAGASRGGGSLVLEATVPAGEKANPVVTDVALAGAGGSVGLVGSTPALAHAPGLTDLGVHGVGAGDYRLVSAVVDGRLLTAPVALTMRSGGLVPLLLVVRPSGITAAAGNDDVNHSLLAAAGQLLRPPDVTFVDQTGRSVPLHSLRGRVLVIAALDAHCHDTCPLYTALWADLQRVIRERGWQDRVTIAEVSMDPERDTPQELAAYGRMAGATWPLLRTDPESTLSFWLSLNATYYKAPAANPAPIDWYTGQPETYHLHHDSLAAVFDQNGDARYLLQGNPQLGHSLSSALAQLMTGGQSSAVGLEKVASWSLTDLLDRIDTVLGVPIESTRGVESAARAGSRAPEIALSGLDSKRVSLLHDEAVHAVAITFWATWCTPCRHDLPLLAAAVREHPGLVVLAVDEGESSGQVRAYLQGVLGADASLLTTVLDPDHSAGARYGVAGLPVTVFVGADGIVQAVRVGELQSADLAAVLARTGA
jgi:cytochrome oxidase Cu insertion factor (SCO1/SenC/PrrC family)/thiol-disulfide isomerase/thioredoxin